MGEGGGGWERVKEGGEGWHRVGDSGRGWRRGGGRGGEKGMKRKREQKRK